MSVKKSWLFILPVIMVMFSCGTATSVSTAVSCTGYTVVENNRYKNKMSKKRENKVKHNSKSYQKKNKRFI